ncbi:MAG: DUF5678 domain-containing protein [Methanosarcinales archaeon]
MKNSKLKRKALEERKAFYKMKSELEKKYYGKIVAIYNGEVVAVSDNYENLHEKLDEMRIRGCFVSRVGWVEMLV